MLRTNSRIGMVLAFAIADALLYSRRQSCGEVGHRTGWWLNRRHWAGGLRRRLLNLPLGRPKQACEVHTGHPCPPDHPGKAPPRRQHPIAMTQRQFGVPIDQQNAERCPFSPELLASPPPVALRNAKSPAASP